MAQLIVIVTKTFFMAKDPYRGAASNLRDHGSLPLGLFGHGARCGFTGLASVMVDGAWWRCRGLLVSPPRTAAGALRRQRGRAPAGDAPVIPTLRTPRTLRTGTRRRTTLNLRSPELPRDREDFSYREDFSLA
jgi:hypothetical protein